MSGFVSPAAYSSCSGLVRHPVFLFSSALLALSLGFAFATEPTSSVQPGKVIYFGAKILSSIIAIRIKHATQKFCQAASFSFASSMPWSDLSTGNCATFSPIRLTYPILLRPVSAHRTQQVHEGRKRLHCAVEHYRPANIRLSIKKPGHFSESLRNRQMVCPLTAPSPSGLFSRYEIKRLICQIASFLKWKRFPCSC